MLENKRVYFWFCLATLLGGFTIFVISLLVSFSATRVRQYEQDGFVIYFNREILPDHLLYPVFMAADRLELMIASDEETVVLQLDFAQKRLDSALALLQHEKTDLAFTTLSKAHQYLMQANQGVVEHPIWAKYKRFLQELDQKFLGQYQLLHEQFSDSQKATLDKMSEELISVMTQL